MSNLKIICTTSNRYLHLIPIFEYLYKKYWNDSNIEIVGYEKPDTSLPFVSLGTQGPVNEWSTDLRRYFESLPDTHFVWLFEDTFIRSFDHSINHLQPQDNIGKVCLTNDIQKREHNKEAWFVFAHPESRYRLSTQPSVWSKKYLLQYLKPNMTPWEFETQDPKNDGWNIIGYAIPPLISNEGVTRHDIFKLNLNGMCDEDVQQIKLLAPWMK